VRRLNPHWKNEVSTTILLVWGVGMSSSLVGRH
jgi:hypothetical protein